MTHSPDIQDTSQQAAQCGHCDGRGYVPLKKKHSYGIRGAGIDACRECALDAEAEYKCWKRSTEFTARVLETFSAETCKDAA